MRYIIPLIVSAGLCYVLYSGVDWSEIADGLRNCRYRWIAAWFVANVAVILFRAVRWRLQLRAIGVNPPLHAMLNAFFGTYAVNLVFPRLGEIWRSDYIARRQSASFTAVFGSMISDRLSDTVCVLLITLATMITAAPAMARFGAQTDLGHKLTLALTSAWFIGFCAIAIMAIVVLLLFPRLRFVARVRSAISGAWQGFISIGRMRRKGVWLLLTAGIWAGYFIATVFSFHAFDATSEALGQYGLRCVLVTFVFGSLAMAVPSNGGIGPWQMAVMLALCGIYGMDRGPALAYATILLGFQTLMFIALGLYTFGAIALTRHRRPSSPAHPDDSTAA